MNEKSYYWVQPLINYSIYLKRKIELKFDDNLNGNKIIQNQIKRKLYKYICILDTATKKSY